MISDYMEGFGQTLTYEEIYDYYKNKGYFGYMKMFETDKFVKALACLSA